MKQTTISIMGRFWFACMVWCAVAVATAAGNGQPLPVYRTVANDSVMVAEKGGKETIPIFKGEHFLKGVSSSSRAHLGGFDFRVEKDILPDATTKNGKSLPKESIQFWVQVSNSQKEIVVKNTINDTIRFINGGIVIPILPNGSFVEITDTAFYSFARIASLNYLSTTLKELDIDRGTLLSQTINTAILDTANWKRVNSTTLIADSCLTGTFLYRGNSVELPKDSISTVPEDSVSVTLHDVANQIVYIVKDIPAYRPVSTPPHMGFVDWVLVIIGLVVLIGGVSYFFWWNASAPSTKGWYSVQNSETKITESLEDLAKFTGNEEKLLKQYNNSHKKGQPFDLPTFKFVIKEFKYEDHVGKEKGAKLHEGLLLGLNDFSEKVKASALPYSGKIILPLPIIQIEKSALEAYQEKNKVNNKIIKKLNKRRLKDNDKYIVPDTKKIEEIRQLLGVGEPPSVDVTLASGIEDKKVTVENSVGLLSYFVELQKQNNGVFTLQASQPANSEEDQSPEVEKEILTALFGRQIVNMPPNELLNYLVRLLTEHLKLTQLIDKVKTIGKEVCKIENTETLPLDDLISQIEGKISEMNRRIGELIGEKNKLSEFKNSLDAKLKEIQLKSVDDLLASHNSLMAFETDLSQLAELSGVDYKKGKNITQVFSSISDKVRTLKEESEKTKKLVIAAEQKVAEQSEKEITELTTQNEEWKGKVLTLKTEHETALATKDTAWEEKVSTLKTEHETALATKDTEWQGKVDKEIANNKALNDGAVVIKGDLSYFKTVVTTIDQVLEVEKGVVNLLQSNGLEKEAYEYLSKHIVTYFATRGAGIKIESWREQFYSIITSNGVIAKSSDTYRLLKDYLQPDRQQKGVDVVRGVLTTKLISKIGSAVLILLEHTKALQHLKVKPAEIAFATEAAKEIRKILTDKEGLNLKLKDIKLFDSSNNANLIYRQTYRQTPFANAQHGSVVDILKYAISENGIGETEVIILE